MTFRHMAIACNTLNEQNVTAKCRQIIFIITEINQGTRCSSKLSAEKKRDEMMAARDNHHTALTRCNKLSQLYWYQTNCEISS